MYIYLTQEKYTFIQSLVNIVNTELKKNKYIYLTQEKFPHLIALYFSI